ncbi:DUF4153 domain-containing protein [Symbioplanes lichenis]|uniref:DUF4153 domain-containing protein n=1 Tax=Symbioplanes lichenis TaxID=1629072 RepID=UPI0027390850|nr:DUF4173 domain-containing protein [Actinoplanes lichenis]
MPTPADQPAPTSAVATKPEVPPPGSKGPGGPTPLPPVLGPWPRLSVWGHSWPGPGRPAAPATVWSLLAAAAVAAISVPLSRGGAGWLVAAVAGVAALTVARLVPQRPSGGPPPLVAGPPRALDPARHVWAVATVLLIAVGTVRAAGWLFVLCLLAAVLTGALAVAGGPTSRSLARVLLLAVCALFRAVPWVGRGVLTDRPSGPAADNEPGVQSPGDSGRGSGGLRVGVTVAVSLALLVVFGGLFASADAAFAGLLEDVVPNVDAVTVVRWVFVFVVAGGVLGGAAYLRAAPPTDGRSVRVRRRVRRLEWAMPLSLLVVLFAVFVGVQLTVLFGGAQHVLVTEGLTYAEYARGGFWQLLVITGLTLLVLAGAARWAPRDTRADRVLIRVVLGALAVLTLVIVASALHRMDLYADTYGLTRLRVLVMLCEAWLGAVFLMILGAGVRLRAAWLPRAVVAAGVLALLGLAAANPERLIADRNIARFEQTGSIDTAYLATLSADAVPALDRLPPGQRACAIAPIARRLTGGPDDWRGWNLGREQARELLADRAPGREVGCPAVRY